MAHLFKEDGVNDMQKKLAAEEIPFYDPSPSVEQSIVSFIQSPPPNNNKAKIMTLFEPTGTGKTTIINNISKIYTNVYQVTIHPSISGYIGRSEVRWRQFFGSVVDCISEFSQTNKSIMVRNPHGLETPFLMISLTVEKVLGKYSFLFLHLDECQLVMNQEFFKTLSSLMPCSHNVKMILTGTTALGNDEINGTSYFQSIACPPLPPFTAERVKKVLNNVLKWEELKMQNQTIEQSEEIKNKIEEEVAGTPKNILYFLQELRNQSKPITKQLLQDTLDGAYYIYKTKQKKMLEQLLNIGKQSFENEALLEKLVMIFSFPNDFGLKKDGNGVLTGSTSNQVIQYLLPFNHSGLVRINQERDDTITLAIPDNFTLRYIRENTLYFPKEWLDTFNNCCTVAVIGYSVQIWLAIMLLNQYSTLSAHVQRIIKKEQILIYYN
ncbi:predicted protein [Naegleria gruberi]|uniref:Predicted protein n=1 Tax=Naegleria gruberi TaxID=5762 RepID=D2VP93_NAEGR|nr:uncharacterized protein NAEGRDRAFT_70774 [Naegleria gruberi]EFC41390.1 predicted protein [Naegleria gruberi]|eukprot:XP_002674134.1 predicted protein [Naegleria gruberi strain NEG-M]